MGILLCSLKLFVNFTVEQIDNVHRIESAVAFDIARPHKIHLVNVVAAQSFDEVRVFDPFRHIGCFLTISDKESMLALNGN